jgi:protein-S-isoprenylcysteine O-methyltransferase Ste14
MEDNEGIKAFGDKYHEYIKKVPMWNFFKWLKSRLTNVST